MSVPNFANICSPECLFAAWEKFRRGKRSRLDVLSFERRLEDNVFNLREKLTNKTYKHGSYQPFTIHDPKQRRISKATVTDRLVHQLIVSAIEPSFEKAFIYDSYSCRKNKGTHAAVKRLRHFLNKGSHNNTKTAYTLKLDISMFFDSVDHEILKGLLNRRIKDPYILQLLGEIIGSYSYAPGKGMPLGNLTSQLFANIYLHELDWFIKHKLRIKYYLRYCDDFAILSNDRQELVGLIGLLEAFLYNRLKLKIHPNKIVLKSWNQGIDWLGYVLKPGCTLLRTKTKSRMIARVNQDNLSSYLGVCSHANTYRLRQDILNKCAHK